MPILAFPAGVSYLFRVVAPSQLLDTSERFHWSFKRLTFHDIGGCSHHVTIKSAIKDVEYFLPIHPNVYTSGRLQWYRWLWVGQGRGPQCVGRILFVRWKESFAIRWKENPSMFPLKSEMIRRSVPSGFISQIWLPPLSLHKNAILFRLLSIEARFHSMLFE